MFRLGLLAVLLSVAAAPAVRAQERSLEGDVARVRTLVEGERWKDATKAIQQIFAQHEGDAAVRGHLKSLEEDLKLSLYRTAAGRITGEAIWGSDCTRLDWASRTVTFSFDDAKSAPWLQQDGMHILPLEFEGTLDISTKCHYIDRDLNQSMILLCFDPDKDGGYVILPGVRQGHNLRAPCKFLRVGGDGLEVVESAAHTTNTNRYGTIEIARRGLKFTVKMGGTKTLTANDRRYKSGYIAFKGPFFSNIKIKGRLEKRFFRRVEGQHHAEKYAEWEQESYKRDEHVPKWLTDVPVDAAPDTGDYDLLPGDAPGGRTASALRLIVRSALNGIPMPLASLISDDLPPSTANFLAAIDAFAHDRNKLAEELFTKVIEEDGDFPLARALRGQVRYGLRDIAGAREDLLAVRDRIGNLPDVHHYLALAELYEANHEAAAEAIRTAVTMGHEDEDTQLLETWTLRALKGPKWTRRFDYESKHYIVSSDHGKKVCYDTAQELEKMREAYIKFLGAPPARAPKARVYVFASREGYLGYAGDLQIDLSWTAGVYLPLVRELALWVPEVTANLENTVRHEGFHQFLHVFADDVPLWFNEGLAQVFGEMRGEKSNPFADNPRHALAARPVREFLTMSTAEFQSGDIGLHYAQSLQLVRAMQADPELNKLLLSYRDALLGGESAADAFVRVLEPEIGKLQKAFDESLD